MIVALLAGLVVGHTLWSQRTASVDVPAQIAQADLQLIEALRLDDTAIFDRASDLYLGVLDSDPGNPEALRGAAIADLGLHRFQLAHDRATRAIELRPDDHVAAAALVDANIELGRYSEAEGALDELLMLRPGLQAYTRLSYLRQLTGDDAGAVEAMFLARSAAAGLGPETARVDALIGELSFAIGDKAQAASSFANAYSADAIRLDARVGEAALAFAADDLAGAQAILDEVFSLDRGYISALILQAQIADFLGDVDLASAAATEVAEGALREHDAGFGIDPSAALAVSSWGDAEIGLQLATIIYEARPDNVKAAHAYAWALHQVGRTPEALAPLEQALRFDTTDGALHRHAAEIYDAAGDLERSQLHRDRAVGITGS